MEIVAAYGDSRTEIAHKHTPHKILGRTVAVLLKIGEIYRVTADG